jgi:sugar phosphate isomerase/epimerase
VKILFHTIAIEPARWTSERVSRPLTELLGPVAQAGFRELEIYEPHLGAKATSSDILEAFRANRQQPVILSSYLNLNPAITTDAEVQEWSEVIAQRVKFYGFGKVRLFAGSGLKADDHAGVAQFIQRVQSVRLRPSHPPRPRKLAPWAATSWRMVRKGPVRVEWKRRDRRGPG